MSWAWSAAAGAVAMLAAAAAIVSLVSAWRGGGAMARVAGAGVALVWAAPFGCAALALGSARPDLAIALGLCGLTGLATAPLVLNIAGNAAWREQGE